MKSGEHISHNDTGVFETPKNLTINWGSSATARYDYWANYQFAKDVLTLSKVTFICEPCTRTQHQECRGGTWCDCGHGNSQNDKKYQNREEV